MSRIFIAIVLVVHAAGHAMADQDKTDFVFDAWSGPALRVFVTRPPALAPDRPVVIVMHGMSRNAGDYRDQWHALAIEHGFLLIVPEFTRENFPTSRSYNSGNVLDEEGRPLARSQWSFNAIEPLFDDVRERFGMNAERYALYGHSAGSQFVHRFLLHLPEARVSRVVAANAGWYTLPDFSVEFPYGLKHSQVSEEALLRFLEVPLTVLLGDRDIDANQGNLRQSPEAKAQGEHRLARGHYFYAAARQAAAGVDARFNWQLSIVEGAHHDNALMAPAAARFLLPQP